MSATAGKMALVNNATALTDAHPTVGVVDIVGYGAADTDHNSTDFIIGAQFQLSSLCNTTVISDG